MSNLTQIVKAARTTARDVLRMEAINRFMDTIHNLKSNLKTVFQDADYADKQVARAEYALSQLDPANPDYADLKEDKEAYLENAKKTAEKMRKDATEVETHFKKEIAENEAKIEAIESGETKISFSRMSELASQIIRDQANVELVVAESVDEDDSSETIEPDFTSSPVQD